MASSAAAATAGDPVLDELDQLSIRELLDQDSRPTFIIDLDPDEGASPKGAAYLSPVFCNSALRLHERLYEIVLGHGGSSSGPSRVDGAAPEVGTGSMFVEFKTWATGVTKHDDSKDIFPLFFEYGNLLWTGSTLRRRWRVISGNMLYKQRAPSRDLGAPIEVAKGGQKVDQSVGESGERPVSRRSKRLSMATSRSTSNVNLTTLASSKQAERLKFNNDSKTSADSSSGKSSGHSKQSIVLLGTERAVIDWTVEKPEGKLSPHLQFVRSVDWGATPLGAMSSWSREFRQIVNLVTSNPHPCCLFWGNEMTCLYNEAYVAEVAGNKHPGLMGTGFSGPFSELWDGVNHIFAEAARTGLAVRRENDYLPIERYGMLEETFFSWSITPLYGGTNKILGFYNAPFETTQAERHRRMMKTMTTLGEFTSRARTVKQFWKSILEGLEENIYDVPFALLYSVGESDDVDHSSTSSGSTLALKSCHLEGSIGVPEGHVAAPKQLDLKRSLDGFIPSFREAMRTREPTILHTRDGTLPEALLEGIKWRGFGEGSNEALIFPVRPTNGDQVLAFLLIGMNPRRPYDDGYKAFVHMLNRHLATSLASVILFEEEMRKSRDAVEAAALEQKRLTEALALQQDRFRRMGEMSPLGLFLVDPAGVMLEANNRFYEMTGLPRGSTEADIWMDSLEPVSRTALEVGWSSVLHDHLPWSGEIQLKKPASWVTKQVDEQGQPIDTWCMLVTQPEFEKDGSLRSVLGSITDISQLKWAQGVQNRRLKEAEETRRQQNEFIDITSHEIRNPLSASLQCADDIMSALEESLRKDAPPARGAIENCIEAARIISTCVQHQKNIVDDILTISKLDSNLLSITPTPCQPVKILRHTVRLIEPELAAKKIELVFQTNPNYKELQVDWTALDQSRVVQILINLLTNAVKFTAQQTERVITVSVGASTEPPTLDHIAGFEFVPTSNRKNDKVTEGEGWGDGKDIYIRFKVQDTGVGLTKAEKQILFARFKQASPRTHAQYGGSGLGLFICKQLCELHGGSIGVASVAGRGSLFGFYVKARRCPPPVSDVLDPRTSDTDLVTQLQNAVAPQRQDIAGVTPGEALLATRAARTFDPAKLRILVVEDNLINQKVLVKQLRKCGCTVSVANDGIEALEALASSRFCKRDDGADLDVILMDLEMPRMNGLDCVRKIREMEKGGEILKAAGPVPVIAVTANVRDEQVHLAKKSGMDDVVAKPFTIPELFGKVEGLLGKLQQQASAAADGKS